MTMVLCNETNQAMYQARHTPPTNYNFSHFPGYMNPQGTQYSSQGQEYGQFQVDPSAFQQQCYMYGSSSRPGDEWINYTMPPTTSSLSPQNTTPGAYNYRTTGHGSMGLDYHQNLVNVPHGNQTLTVLGSPPQSEGSPTASTSSGGSCGSPSNKQLRPPFDWMKKTSYNTSGSNNGKTRTKDKYRVVYSDHQRLELEKEFHYSRYITIRRKAELAQTLALSERQVKIWFQNRRAKERKQNKKREEAVGGIKSEVQGHCEASGHMQQMSLDQSQMAVPMVKPDPGEEFQTNTSMTPITADHINGHLQSSALSVQEPQNFQQHSPLSVHSSAHAKMDANDVVTQA